MEVTLIYPNQLFDPHPAIARNRKIFLLEDPLFFGDEKYPLNFNKKKLLLHFLSMTSYANKLKNRGFSCEIIALAQLTGDNYFSGFLKLHRITKIHLSEVVDFELNNRINKASKETQTPIDWHANPNFLLSSSDVKDDFSGKKFYFMANFYKKQRKRYNILINSDNKPFGGKWSFDEENRKKFPKNMDFPENYLIDLDKDLFKDALRRVEDSFSKNLGNVENFNFPYNHDTATTSFENFLKNSLELFGPYEDAIPKTNSSLFHSVLTPYLNIGLISPKKVIQMTLDHAKEFSIPMNSLEGFIRQIIGWREFIRGMYQENGIYQRTKNFWNFNKRIPQSFYNSQTGIEPVDFVINKSVNSGYAHHIERLMIMGNILFLLKIKPDDVYQWFMESYIDAYDWVMVPNVYGMSQFSDGGLMSTKPYISGSNYILKMSDYKKGIWSNLWDALYWEFINEKRAFFLKNPRMGMMVRLYDKKSNETKNAYKKTVNSFDLK